MTIRKFKYKKYNVTIQSFKDSWDKKITIQQGKYKNTIIYSLKHMEDAIKAAKNSIDSRINPKKYSIFNKYQFRSRY